MTGDMFLLCIIYQLTSGTSIEASTVITQHMITRPFVMALVSLKISIAPTHGSTHVDR